MSVEVFGKSVHDILGSKQSFFVNNREKLEKAHRDAAVYVAQPRRLFCKICSHRLPSAAAFIKHGIGYSYCEDCGHLNGAHEDTDVFCEYLYVREGGEEYAQNYVPVNPASRQQRVEKVYLPKAEFALGQIVANPAETEVVDFGCGAGFLLEAFRALGVREMRGHEPSATLQRQAEEVLGSGVVQRSRLDGIEEIVSSERGTLACMVGFIEHVQDPVGLLKALVAANGFDYLLVTFPLASPSVAVEAVFPQVMPRHLSGGHTHVFTRESIARLEELTGIERAAEWWFGTDMLDLFRSVLVSLEDSGAERLAEEWTRAMLPAIDAMQLALDRRKDSSQVHMLYRIRR